MQFGTASAYIEALKRDLTLALVPLTVAAEALDITRAAIDRMLRAGQLEEIQIGAIRYVRAQSLIDREQDFIEQVAVVRAELERIAAAGGTADGYQPLMSKIGLSHKVPADRRKIGEILGEVSRQTLKEHGILLSAIVHHKGTDRPGKGFANYFREKADPEWQGDDDAWIDYQMQRVWNFYHSKKAA
jgi:hypothetical protein